MKNFGVYLMGGLGNQIFQYLFALKLRQRAEGQVTLFIDWFLGNQMLNRAANRPLLLHRLPGLSLPLTTLGLAAESGSAFGRIHRYEQEGGLASLDQLSDGNVLVMGYYQSPEALPDAAQLAEFCRGLHLAQSPDDANVVAVHVRLGDYRHIQDTLPILPLRYYELALAAQPPGSRFLVFAEDVGEATGFLSPLASRFPLEFLSPGDPLDDFLRLAAMPRIVGANSTFSFLAGLVAIQRGTRVHLPAAEYWHGVRFQQEIEGKRALLGCANFDLVPFGS
jgi:hypothetical protein